MKIQFHRWVFVFVLLLNQNVFAAQGSLPSSWYVLPEDAVQSKDRFLLESTATEPDQTAVENINRIFDANTDALSLFTKSRSSNMPDWHPEFFIIDLGVTLSGLSGLLVLKGTPSVSVFFRRQNTTVKETTAVEPVKALETVQVDEQASLPQIRKQLEPTIKTLVASGKVEDENQLRSSLYSVAESFQELTRGLARDCNGCSWWVSRFRLDLTVDSMGRVNPVITVGGNVQIRFEWHRMKYIGASQVKLASLNAASSAGKLETLVRGIATDLEVVSEDPWTPGFKAYQFKVGIGMSAKGDIGLSKTAGTFLGQLYFSHDVKKPTVNPKLELATSSIPLIEKNPTPRHLQYAKASGIDFDQGIDDVVYSISHERFQEGLRKAARMGSFFTERANQKQKTDSEWKVYEVRTLFDFSVTGTFGLSVLSGLASAEINFYNTDF